MWSIKEEPVPRGVEGVELLLLVVSVVVGMSSTEASVVVVVVGVPVEVGARVPSC